MSPDAPTFAPSTGSALFPPPRRELDSPGLRKPNKTGQIYGLENVTRISRELSCHDLPALTAGAELCAIRHRHLSK